MSLNFPDFSEKGENINVRKKNEYSVYPESVIIVTSVCPASMLKRQGIRNEFEIVLNMRLGTCFYS